MSAHAWAVAPLVGAWIEIPLLRIGDIYIYVAPLVGAWIEIGAGFWQCLRRGSRSPCGSVD